MANRRFEMHEYRQILVRLRLGDSDRDISRTGLMGRRKAGQVREVAQAHGWLDVGQALPDDAALARVLSRPRQRPQTTSQVAPFEADVRKWVKAGIQGTTIHDALQRKHGFTGSYSAVRRFIQSLHLNDPKATTILEFEPGDTAQVDFGRGPTIIDVDTGEIIKTWIFVMVLAWSRHMYAELVLDQKIPTWLGCHRRAFEWFGGVPARVMLDNLKTAITKACYYDPAVQRSYAECAEGYGFRLAPNPVRQPQMKGRVESGVKYVAKAFVPLRDFRNMADGNAQLRQWLLGPAGNRIHGSTRERPLTRFTETERYVLRPLPPAPVELVQWAKVKLHGDCHVQFQQVLYSAPYTLVRQELWLRASETTVRLFRKHELVATHPRLTRRGARSTCDGHLPPEAQAFKMQDPQWCLKQAERVGPHCHELVQALFAHRVLDNLRAAQGVVGLARSYGSQRLEAACQRALAFDSPKRRTVKTILDKGLDFEPLPETTPAPLSGPYTGQGRYCRDTTDFFGTTHSN